MNYIRVERFWDFQNADAWKKAAAAKKDSSRHPNWCKLVVRRDFEMDQLPLPTRLLYLELLRLATEHSNVIPNESEWIAKQISMEPGAVVDGLEQLLKGRWIKVTRSSRLSRELLETFSQKSRLELEREKERTTFLPTSTKDAERKEGSQNGNQQTLPAIPTILKAIA